VSDFVTVPSCEKPDMTPEVKVDLGKTKMGSKLVETVNSISKIVAGTLSLPV
jgi:hypothetical protein